VFPLVGRSGVEVVREDDDLNHGGSLYNGNTQSTWVAEKLVEIALFRGVPGCVDRPSLISGDSRTGAWNKDDCTCKMIKTWVGLGTAPKLDTQMNMVPVDYVARAIVRLSLREGSLGKRFHLANPHPASVNDMVAWIEAFGYPLERVPYDEWRAELLNPTRSLRRDDLYSLAPLLSMSAAADGSARCPNSIAGTPKRRSRVPGSRARR
jgi:thioester reductase-like protein